MAKFPALEVAVPVRRITLPDPDDKPSNGAGRARKSAIFSALKSRSFDSARDVTEPRGNRKIHAKANYRPVLTPRDNTSESQRKQTARNNPANVALRRK